MNSSNVLNCSNHDSARDFYTRNAVILRPDTIGLKISSLLQQPGPKKFSTL